MSWQGGFVRSSGLAALFWVVACSAAGAPPSGSDGGFGNEGSGAGGRVAAVDGGLDGSPGAGGTGLGGPGSGGVPALPPEEEEVGTFRPPVITGKHLWSSNPESGRVALIDAETLSIRVLAAGLEPTYLAAVPGEVDEPSALVLNVGNRTATLFRAASDEVRAFEVRTHAGANRWAVAPSGDWAAAFSLGSEGLDPTQGLQDVSLLDLRGDEPEATQLTAGYRPREVLFDQDETRLIVISSQGVSTFELDGKGQVFVPLSGDDFDVSVTKDGQHALVHEQGTADIQVVSLRAGGAATTLTLPGEITDVDLAPSGRALAVLRELSLVVTFQVEDVLEDASAYQSKTISGELVGSAELSRDGKHAVLYTNATDSDRVTILNLSDPDLPTRTVATQTPVASVRLSPDGKHAIVLGRAQPGSSFGSFAVVAVEAARFPRIVGTQAPIAQVALEDVAGVVTTTSTAGVHEAYVVSLPSLNVAPLALASPPLAAGILTEQGLGFVSQSHAAGRVSFFDFEASEMRTLTGFELSAEVVDE